MRSCDALPGTFNSKSGTLFLVIAFFVFPLIITAQTTVLRNTNPTDQRATRAVTLPPSVNTFDPVVGSKGSGVYIMGLNLNGARNVKFGGTPALSVRQLTETRILAVVGEGSFGDITLETYGGTASHRTFFMSIPRLLLQ